MKMTKGNLTATLVAKIKVHMSIWDALKIRISGLPAIDKILKTKKKKSLIDILTKEGKIN
jgi:hypothetical protein